MCAMTPKSPTNQCQTYNTSNIIQFQRDYKVDKSVSQVYMGYLFFNMFSIYLFVSLILSKKFYLSHYQLQPERSVDCLPVLHN